MTYLDALILGIVEGLTEFLPVSSTGHLIVASNFLGLAQNNFLEMFEIFIQLGAILAVVLLQRKKIIHTLCNLKEKSARNFALNIIIATIPAVILGLFFSQFFKDYFFNSVSVAIALIIGGFIILLVDKPQNVQIIQPNDSDNYADINNMSLKTALQIGILQCLALIPGVSRSGATIIGGMYLGLPRIVATSFSFFLAIPIIFGASLHDVVKYKSELNPNNIILLLIGSIVGFATAWICIKWLIKYVATHSFISFAWYRIIFGLILIGLYFMNILSI